MKHRIYVQKWLGNIGLSKRWQAHVHSEILEGIWVGRGRTALYKKMGDALEAAMSLVQQNNANPWWMSDPENFVEIET